MAISSKTERSAFLLRQIRRSKSQKEDEMNTREIALLGKAMQALVKAGAMDAVKELIDYMAAIDKPEIKDSRND